MENLLAVGIGKTMKKLNYKVGALKRKFAVPDFKPGELITKMNEMKVPRVKQEMPVDPKKKLAVKGLI